MPAGEIHVLFKALQNEVSAKEAFKIQRDWKNLGLFYSIANNVANCGT